MPGPKDLMNEVYGDLTVIEDTGKVTNTKRKPKIWLCQCQCGRKEEINQGLLPHNKSQSKRRGIRTACTICMRGACKVCGNEIISSTHKHVCSENCFVDYKRSNWRKSYYSRIKDNPELNKEMHKKMIGKIVADPKKYQAYLAKERIRGKLRQKLNGKAINEKARVRYWINHEDNINKKREYRANNIDEIYKNNRKYYNDNSEHILKLRADKINTLSDSERLELRNKINSNARKLKIERLRKEELEKLFGVQAKLKGIDDE